MSSYDWSQFHVHMYYLAPLDEVFDRFSTGDGLASFFIGQATHTTTDGRVRAGDERVAAGDTYHWQYLHDFDHGGTFEVVEPGKRVQISFGEMTVNIRFREVEGATEVDLHQTGCALEDPDRVWQHVNCRSCWIYFLTNLRSVLAGGPDIRDHIHPQWNDSVAIGWEAPAGH